MYLPSAVEHFTIFNWVLKCYIFLNNSSLHMMQEAGLLTTKAGVIYSLFVYYCKVAVSYAKWNIRALRQVFFILNLFYSKWDKHKGYLSFISTETKGSVGVVTYKESIFIFMFHQ